MLALSSMQSPISQSLLPPFTSRVGPSHESCTHTYHISYVLSFFSSVIVSNVVWYIQKSFPIVIVFTSIIKETTTKNYKIVSQNI